MCGILGAIGVRENQTAALNSISHRGPDDFGEYLDEARGVYLGHRRLSIIDLSAAGRQPMELANDSLVITFNGEIYNFRDLKQQFFRGAHFASGTDTEVILHLYRKFGAKTPQFLRGMFAFGLYDKAAQELFLCRDRLGIKPLYYYHKDNLFAFSSELAPIKQMPDVDLEIDPMGLDYYFNYGYIPSPFTAYKHIRKLRPGHFLRFDVARDAVRSIAPYWQLKNAVGKVRFASEEEWLVALEDKIREAVRLRLMSDVPLGAFLSGGLDSSLMVALMAEMMQQPVKTFTIGFDYEQYDERVYAEAVARRYETEHHVEIVKPDTLAILPRLIQSFGEPFFDKSAIPTYYVSEIARKNVTVALSGDGGDEVFAGYTRYARMHRYAYLKGIPVPVRKVIQHLGKYLPQSLPGYGFLQRLPYDNVQLYREMHSCFPGSEQAGLYTDAFKRLLQNQENDYYQQILDEQNGLAQEVVTQLQLIDLHSYMPEDILTKVDRMSMLHSLETRVPLIDHELVEMAYSCPASIRYKNRTLKYIIKRILQDKVPREVIQHKKQGFGVPLPMWFRNEMKAFTQAQIDKTRDDAFINHNYVQKIFDMHQKGGRNFSKYLYTILIYQTWRTLEREKAASLS